MYLLLFVLCKGVRYRLFVPFEPLLYHWGVIESSRYRAKLDLDSINKLKAQTQSSFS